jgi:hypothetical protein
MLAQYNIYGIKVLGGRREEWRVKREKKYILDWGRAEG